MAFRRAIINQHHSQLSSRMFHRGPLTIKERGEALLNNPYLNKGTAFTRDERKNLDLNGKLPYAIATLDMQCERAYQQVNISVYHTCPGFKPVSVSIARNSHSEEYVYTIFEGPELDPVLRNLIKTFERNDTYYIYSN